ncbi:SLA1 Homology Domain 1 (SHD1) protein [Roseimicrobium gellanilyticum]|uniref:SLA1 Homology Domain 1 (SHD1) protein n=1 Tax=Roseimicrobium gellanilyticum TaxID=748857 RepID=A0A366HPC7_9BACT|nr:serine hydrolase domain-containing protein [Roseimicrobium gellanilyticum]RBP43835.1 SLA1 Homology Domain 1 (SHD1) protein [Roseimicrobium gellanilyticum]
MSKHLPLALALWCTCVLPGFLQARTWTEAASGRKIDAEFVSSDAGSVTILMRSGQKYTLPLSRLAPEDQAFVQEQLRNKKTPPGETPRGGPKVKDRFEDIKKLTASEIPVNGEAHPALAKADVAIQGFMAEKGIGALTFALSKNGKVLHDRAFGWADSSLKTPLQPGVKMRVASLTKPVVKSAILTLIDAGKLKLEDQVYTVLQLDQYKEAKACDARWKAVTIDQLLEHKGGWDRDQKAGDLTTHSSEMERMFRLKPDELEPIYVVRYGLTLPLDFDPGTKESYCNFGYVLLARVIEKVSGQKFVDCLQQTVCKESAAPSFSMSASDARRRQVGEVWYSYHPEYTQEQIPLSFQTEAYDGAGGLACTAADYSRFLEKYWVSGKPRKEGGYRYAFDGSLPGVTAICSQRLDGINYTAIANRRDRAGSDWNGELRKRIEEALDPVAGQLP